MDFIIELHPSTPPISMTPHRMGPVELQELKVLLQELLDLLILGIENEAYYNSYFDSPGTGTEVHSVL